MIEVFLLQLVWLRKVKSPIVCSGNGKCLGNGKCVCNSGYFGKNCQITHCYGFTSGLADKVCSGNGKCISPNVCECDEGWAGHKCQLQK